MTLVSVTKDMLEALGSYLDTMIPELVQVLYQFPEANDVLKYPSLCITTTSTEHQNQMPYIYSMGAIPTAAPIKTATKYVVGEYVFGLQLDLWASSKEQRHALYDKFYTGFNSQLPKAGLFLTLKNYHNVNCNYLITAVDYQDSDIDAQRKEWRAIIRVEANCVAVLAKDEFIITDTDVTLETPDNIPEP